jgi:hypothetical protein
VRDLERRGHALFEDFIACHPDLFEDPLKDIFYEVPEVETIGSLERITVIFLTTDNSSRNSFNLYTYLIPLLSYRALDITCIANEIESFSTNITNYKCATECPSLNMQFHVQLPETDQIWDPNDRAWPFRGTGDFLDAPAAWLSWSGNRPARDAD